MQAKRVVGLVLVLVLALIVVPALAQERTGVGRAGQLAVGADRMFGVGFTTRHWKQTATGTQDTQTRFEGSLLLASIQSTPYEIPRVTIDYFAIDGLSLGGSLGLSLQTGKSKQEPVGVPADENDVSGTGYVLAPRVGYALRWTDGIAFWPRAGITYYANSASSTTGPTEATKWTWKSTVRGVAVDIEAPLVLSVGGFAFVAAPVLDLPLSGTYKTEITYAAQTTTPTDDTYTFVYYGLTFGVLGYF